MDDVTFEPDATVVLAAAPELADLRRLPPVPQPDDRRARAEHLSSSGRRRPTARRDRACAPARTATWGRSRGSARTASSAVRTARATSATRTPSSARRRRRCRRTSRSPPRSRDRRRAIVRVTSAVDNFGAGHDFPTGISLRNAILWITATLDGQPLTQVAGPTSRSGARTTCRAISRATSPDNRARDSPRCSRGGSTARDRSCGRCCSSTPRASTRRRRSLRERSTPPRSSSRFRPARPRAALSRSPPSCSTVVPSGPSRSPRAGPRPPTATRSKSRWRATRRRSR